MRLIDGNELLQNINCEGQAHGINFTKEQVIQSMNGMRDYIIDVIKKQPTIDAEPVVHAHWIYNTDDFTPKNRCSHCGYNKSICAGEGIKQEPDDYCNKCGAKMDEKNAVDIELMKSKLKTAMKDLLQRNCICDYVFVQNKQEVYRQNIYALDAYMLAYNMATNGNVECYMAPNGVKAVKPVFTVIDGVVTLSGLTIQ